MPHAIWNFRVKRRVKSKNFHWSILFARFSSFQSIVDILDSSIRSHTHSTWILANHVVHNTKSRFHPLPMKYWQNDTTLNVILYRSDILSHHSRQSTSLSSSFRELGSFPPTHRTCTSFWNIFSSSSSKTIGTSVGRESRRFDTNLLWQQTSRGAITVNAFRVSFSRDNLDWMYFPHSTLFPLLDS